MGQVCQEKTHGREDAWTCWDTGKASAQAVAMGFGFIIILHMVYTWLKPFFLYGIFYNNKKEFKEPKSQMETRARDFDHSVCNGAPLFLKCEWLTSVCHQSAINQPSVRHQSAINPPSIRHQSAINPPSIRHQPATTLLCSGPSASCGSFFQWITSTEGQEAELCGHVSRQVV